MFLFNVFREFSLEMLHLTSGEMNAEQVLDDTFPDENR